MDIKNPRQKIAAKIANSAIIKRIIIFLKRLVPPGFQGISFYEAMRFFIRSLIKGTLSQRAAAITYHIFIAIFPALLVLFSVISYLNESIKETLLFFIESSVPHYTWPAISGVITEIVMGRNGTLLSFSFVFAVYFTLSGINHIITNLNDTYFEIETRSSWKQLLVSLLITVIAIIVIIAAAGVFVSTAFIFRKLNIEIFGSSQFYSYSVSILKWVLLFVLIYFFISALYYFSPVNKKYFKFFSPGSIFSTVMMVILLYILNFYFANFLRYNVLYGSIGALLAVLLWTYWNSIIILIGYDLNISVFVAKQKQQTLGGKLILDPLQEKCEIK